MPLCPPPSRRPCGFQVGVRVAIGDACTVADTLGGHDGSVAAAAGNAPPLLSRRGVISRLCTCAADDSICRVRYHPRPTPGGDVSSPPGAPVGLAGDRPSGDGIRRHYSRAIRVRLSTRPVAASHYYCRYRRRCRY